MQFWSPPIGWLSDGGLLEELGQDRRLDDPNSRDGLEALNDLIVLSPDHQILLKVAVAGLQTARLLSQGDDDIGRKLRNARRLAIEKLLQKLERKLNEFGQHDAELGHLAEVAVPSLPSAVILDSIARCLTDGHLGATIVATGYPSEGSPSRTGPALSRT